MINTKLNSKKYSLKKINLYYYNLLATKPTKVVKNIYKITYPMLYKEVYYFGLSGQTLKVTPRNLNLNTIIKYRSVIDKSKFILCIPIQLPYIIY